MNNLKVSDYPRIAGSGLIFGNLAEALVLKEYFDEGLGIFAVVCDTGEGFRYFHSRTSRATMSMVVESIESADSVWQKELHSCREFWNEHVHKMSLQKQTNSHERVCIKGHHYVVAPDSQNKMSSGFGGAAFNIRFTDGTLVTTRNLRHNGIIPPEFRERLSDNAVFERQ